jgi:hypothetical protein
VVDVTVGAAADTVARAGATAAAEVALRRPRPRLARACEEIRTESVPRRRFFGGRRNDRFSR